MNWSRRLQCSRLVRLYQSERGIWRYEIERGGGKVRWASLHTRDEAKARRMYERMKADNAQPASGGVEPPVVA